MSAAGLLDPLLGDTQGKYRIQLTGNSGTGKSTLGVELASILNVEYISLDRHCWRPGFVKTPREAFRAEIGEVLERAEKEKGGWVVDGSYYRALGGLVSERATDIVWLDPPLALYFPRIILRTILRLLRLIPPCSPGCPESIREAFFSRDSIIWYCLSSHWRVRKREEDLLETDGVSLGKGGKRRRIGGWGRQLEAWKEEVRKMVADNKENGVALS